MSSPLRLPDPSPAPDHQAAPGSRGRARASLRLAPRRRPRPPRVPFVVVVALIALGGVVGLLLFNTSMQQASFAASALERQATGLAAREQKLQMELEAMRDPQQLARAARDAGMVAGSGGCFLTLGSGRTTGPCGPASPDDRMAIEPAAPPVPRVLDPAPRLVDPPATRPSDPPAEPNQLGDTDRGSPARGAGDARNGGPRTD